MHTITPHRFDEESVLAYREHEGQIDDEHDAARDYESEAGRYEALTFGENVFAWSVIVFGLATFALAVAVLFGHNPF